MILKTCQEWQEESDVIVYDPDGWDKKNYDYSWFEEKISLVEFEKRFIKSICKRKNDRI